MYIKKVKTKKPPKQRDLEIIAEFEQGRNLQAVGTIFGISRQRVHQILLKNGIETKPKTKYIPKEILEDLYINQKLSVVKICNLLKSSITTFSKSVVFYGMPSAKERDRRPEIVKIPKDTLEDLFIGKKIAVVKIAKLLKVSQQALRHNLDEYGMSRPNIYTQTERNHIDLNKDELYLFYVEKKYTLTKVVEHFNCQVSDVRRGLKKFKILKVPKISETKRKRNNERKASEKFIDSFR